MGMGSSGGGGTKVMADINVTPMVDVMLVLMIIFMVTAPLMQQGVSVDLPQANAESMDVNPDLTVLTITKDEKYFLGETEIAAADLETKLAGNLKLRKDKEIYLHADRSLPYGVVVDIMALMKRAGVENLGMVTDPVGAGGETSNRRKRSGK